MDETKVYIFKKKYECQLGKIDEGRIITTFRGMVFIDGGMIPPSMNNIPLNVVISLPSLIVPIGQV
jgi:hypothetical protein